MLRVADSIPIVFNVARDWLNQRIATRFESMIAEGALDEMRTLLPVWSPELPCAKAIGARQLVAYLNGETSLETAQYEATIATQQFAKRQRTWFRSKMADWHSYAPSEDAHPMP
jgi:tRNA dimethylallyltransferase